MPDEFLQDAVVIPNRLAAWHERLHESRTDRFTHIAVSDDRIVGFICAFAKEDPTWGSCIDNLHVAADYHRRGIGAGLMITAGRWLGTHAPDCGVYLWVMEANVSARAFYQRLGGRPQETILKPDPGGGSARNCRYTWSRPSALVSALEK